MKKVIVLALLFASAYSYAQQAYKGKIINTANTPLSGANIIAANNPSHGVMSDAEGNFEITLDSLSEIVIRFIGYKTKKTILQNSFNTIELTEDNVVLEEVFVTSASREVQKRSEVPGSISIINTQNIKETKAFGIDQLVNQVPGVFMSSSKSSSNEQHMMSVRSPISTKALFLYLEDGLQIRPTSVFNHNALLEMNNTAFGRVEVLKGPASSIYGSESIGGSFNFITKNPSKELSGSLGYQINDLGLTRYELEVSDQTHQKFGFYIGGHYVQREDGPIEHSDYEKFAVTFKTVYDFSTTTKWTTVLDAIDYRSDMSGSLSEADYSGGNFESDQTFTEREAISFRARTTLDKFWNDTHKTSLNFIFRNNRMDQNPSYRIRQFRDRGQLTGLGSGELNSNKFRSYVGLIQHKFNLNFANSSLIIGATADYSPQDYAAETIAVTVDPLTGRNIDFALNTGDYILNYEADIFNYAGYFQYEISPIQDLKITAAMRYDQFEYDYDNQLDGVAGAKDSKNSYENFTPKLGVNYNFNKQTGMYANYSNGFTPPQISTLYRNRFVGAGGLVFDLKPSKYDNYEIGGYFTLPSKWKLDVALYLLEGKNTLVTLRNENDEFFNANAGRTQSYGIEYGVTYTPLKGLSLTHNGSYAKHRYITFFDKDVDYSDTDRSSAPNLLGTSIITYRKDYANTFGFSIAATHELVGSYNTSLENQALVTDSDGNIVTDTNGNRLKTTTTYDGHNIFNLQASINYKGFEVWSHLFNVFDELYSVRASYNQYRNENSYSIGNPRAFHLGIKYNF